MFVPQHAQRRVVRAARLGRLGGVLRDLGQVGPLWGTRYLRSADGSYGSLTPVHASAGVTKT